VHIELPEELLRQVEAQTGIKISEYTINFYGYRQEVSVIDEKFKISNSLKNQESTIL
jgi:Fe2+ or Zn2+ uptake regulation protein